MNGRVVYLDEIHDPSRQLEAPMPQLPPGKPELNERRKWAWNRNAALFLFYAEGIVNSSTGKRGSFTARDMIAAGIITRDGLTGIFNRRYLEDALDREIRRAIRNANCVSVILLDVDHFKKFNDTYGHEAGDALLVELGALLKSFVRTEDIPCRYGGEEFTVILPGATLDVAARRAEELRIMARNTLKITHRAEKIGGVTLSVGVASFPDHALAQDALMRLADQALYQAKQAGRDRVVVAAQFRHPP